MQIHTFAQLRRYSISITIKVVSNFSHKIQFSCDWKILLCFGNYFGLLVMNNLGLLEMRDFRYGLWICTSPHSECAALWWMIRQWQRLIYKLFDVEWHWDLHLFLHRFTYFLISGQNALAFDFEREEKWIIRYFSIITIKWCQYFFVDRFWF